MTTQGDFGYVDPDGTYTGGWSGSEASHDRAVGDEQTGRAKDRRDQVWDVVRLAGLHGATWPEVAAALGLHHGQATGALSNLHKAGRLARLKDRRGRCSIYVVPHAVNGRTVAPHGRVRPSPEVVGAEPQPTPQEAYRQGQADAQAEREAFAREQYDAGWQVGYDEGTAQSAPEDQIAEALRDGAVMGSQRVKQNAVRVITEMQKVAGHGKPALNGHNANCWLEHPECALRLAAKAVAQA